MILYPHAQFNNSLVINFFYFTVNYYCNILILEKLSLLQIKILDHTSKIGTRFDFNIIINYFTQILDSRGKYHLDNNLDSIIIMVI